MSRPVEVLKYQGKYPMVMKKELMGHDMNREGEECWQQRIYMYLGAVRLDVSDYNAAQVKMIVTKLELMGLAGE